MISITLYLILGCLTTNTLSLLTHEVVNPEHTVVIFAFSGLRWDMIDFAQMPALLNMKREGLYVKQKHDPFQTESLPSFITMVTGQYPEYHGILANKMIERKAGFQFTPEDTDKQWWRDVHPVWARNQKTGNKSALCYWPGHHVKFHGKHADYMCLDDKYADPFVKLTGSGESKGVMPFEKRLDKVKYWLSLNKTSRPSFIGVYFEEPLKTAMKYGVKSNETRKALRLINSITQRMLDFLQATKMHDKINFVVASESGVTDFKEDFSANIFLKEIINNDSKYKIIDNGPITTLNTKLDRNETKEFISFLRNASQNYHVYDGKLLPKHFHYYKEQRTMPIIIAAKEGYRINHDRKNVSPNKAAMGYDGKYESTHALFLAQGPAFKKRYYIASLRNVDVYNIICKALKIVPAENAGIWNNVRDAMTKDKKWYTVVIKSVVKSPARFTIAIIFALILLFTALYLVILSITKTSERCCRTYATRRFEVFTPNKAFRKQIDDSDDKHLLDEEESEVSDLEEDLHFHIHKDTDENEENNTQLK